MREAQRKIPVCAGFTGVGRRPGLIGATGSRGFRGGSAAKIRSSFLANALGCVFMDRINGVGALARMGLVGGAYPGGSGVSGDDVRIGGLAFHCPPPAKRCTAADGFAGSKSSESTCVCRPHARRPADRPAVTIISGARPSKTAKVRRVPSFCGVQRGPVPDADLRTPDENPGRLSWRADAACGHKKAARQTSPGGHLQT